MFLETLHDDTEDANPGNGHFRDRLVRKRRNRGSSTTKDKAAGSKCAGSVPFFRTLPANYALFDGSVLVFRTLPALH